MASLPLWSFKLHNGFGKAGSGRVEKGWAENVRLGRNFIWFLVTTILRGNENFYSESISERYIRRMRRKSNSFPINPSFLSFLSTFPSLVVLPVKTGSCRIFPNSSSLVWIRRMSRGHPLMKILSCRSPSVILSFYPLFAQLDTFLVHAIIEHSYNALQIICACPGLYRCH